MRYAIGLVVLVMFRSLQAYAFDQNHQYWTDVLRQYQDAKGMVKYKELKADIANSSQHPLARYLRDLTDVKLVEFNSWSANDQKAFLINAYNAYTLQLIVDHYPVKSIKKIGGLFKKPWGIEFFSLLDGKIKSLDPIEHEWLRPKFKDYRIHAAVNCASYSCPPLRHEAYVGGKLDAQLNEQMKLWLGDRTRNQIEGSSREFKISKIFDWYKKDFEAWGGGVLPVIVKYFVPPLSPARVQNIEIAYLDYNWDLNEAK